MRQSASIRGIAGIVGVVTYRGVVDMKMSFLDTLSVVSLRIGQSEQTFLEEFTTELQS
jgi:hypothetical protein